MYSNLKLIFLMVPFMVLSMVSGTWAADIPNLKVGYIFTTHLPRSWWRRKKGRPSARWACT
jgi:hypothetical protein